MAKKEKYKPSLPKRVMMRFVTFMCTCKKCPSYPECSGGKCDRVLYCGWGKSPMKIKAKGCICKACPVYKMRKFSGDYYCVTGVAKENLK